MRSHHQIPVYCAQLRDREGWLTLSQAAALLTICAKTLRLAAQRGEVEALHPLADGPWIFNRTALASEPVRRLQPYHRTRDTSAGPDARQQNLNLSMT